MRSVLARHAPAPAVALVILGWAPGAARAATILDQSVQVDIRPDGSVLEATRLAVRLDSTKDFAAWSPYAVYMDDNRRLVRLEASLTEPGGKVQRVGRKELDTAEIKEEDVIHTSAKLRTVEIPVGPAGSVFRVEYQVEIKPYFPASHLALGGGAEPIERLRVEIQGGGAGWRWRIDGSRDGLTVEEAAGRVVVTASHLPAAPDPPQNAPEQSGPVLRYAWGPRSTWEAVGGWARDLFAQVARGSAPIRRKAQEVAAREPTRLGKLQALAALARQDVRYVAVEVGIGGYRPAPPESVLGRGWGDCKDKALLLVDLLNAAGIEAWPVLIRLAPAGKVDREFPAPDTFNHAIVAVAAAGLELAPDAPVADGFLFIDATETLGSALWLPPAVQDQDALVLVGNAGNAGNAGDHENNSRLVRTPTQPGRETGTLSVQLAATAAGEGVGQAQLEIQGEAGAGWVGRMATRRPDENEADARALLAAALPGATLTDLSWKALKEGVPSLSVRARVRLPGLLPARQAGGGERSFSLGTLAGLPAPGLLDERTVPVVLTPKVTRTLWQIRLDDESDAACRPAPGQDIAVDNELGGFRQSVSITGGLLAVERRAEVRRRWIEPGRFAALRDIALAERRASKRLLRLTCGGGG